MWQDAENLDATHGYTSYIWIPDETLQIKLLKLHVYAEKFRAFSKAASSGGGSEETSSDGGGCTPTTAPTGNIVKIIAIGTTTTCWGFSSNERTTGIPSATDFVNHILMRACPDGHAYCQLESSNAKYFGTSIHTHEMPVLSAFNVPDVYHDLWLATQNHIHEVTISDHSHTVTIPNHTHPIEYGIYEEAITGRTLSAKLYDPDDNLLKDFGVIITGEDDLILDLSDYFETLQHGMFRLELTASDRLRARLIYYELCVMSAVS